MPSRMEGGLFSEKDKRHIPRMQKCPELIEMNGSPFVHDITALHIRMSNVADCMAIYLLILVGKPIDPPRVSPRPPSGERSAWLC